MKPYFESAIEPELKAGKTVLIAAHGNSLRAIVKMLDNLSEEEIAKVNIPTAMPLLYEWRVPGPGGCCCRCRRCRRSGPEVSLSR